MSVDFPGNATSSTPFSQAPKSTTANEFGFSLIKRVTFLAILTLKLVYVADRGAVVCELRALGRIAMGIGAGMALGGLFIAVCSFVMDFHIKIRPIQSIASVLQ